jgi:hypothetical protein
MMPFSHDILRDIAGNMVLRQSGTGSSVVQNSGNPANADAE